MSFHFALHAQETQYLTSDGSKQQTTLTARRGTFSTPHGSVETPAFMPVGTQGTVKGITLDQLRATGAQMILGNTYHLSLRPGEEVIRQLGGLHGFTGWEGPILTDSGGFQLFSLAEMCKVTEERATFKSHLDGSKIELSPERAVAIQQGLGSDVMMILDHVVALPCSAEVIHDATLRSIRWARRCQNAQTSANQALFAIVQGGLDADLRMFCAREMGAMDFIGYAVGGLSVGEAPAEMYRILEATTPCLPVEKPRYLMGVGRPIDLLEGIRRGIDLFDCVMPTRNGRNALAFTDYGAVRIKNRKYLVDPSPLEDHCPCPACRHSKSYLRHLFHAEEMLGPILLSLHNLYYYQRLMRDAREAIIAGTFEDFYAQKIAGWQREFTM
ncbi:MAG: tRNA guanosine(34) transglycosylase Tgt [Pirellulales bacterium]|nr:tRNA guanosine(34) transglycosylase Tgt [Pirellulales bacterium]